MGEQFSSYIMNLDAAYFSTPSLNFYQSIWHHIQVQGVDTSFQSSSAYCKALTVVVVVVVVVVMVMVMVMSMIYGILYDID